MARSQLRGVRISGVAVVVPSGVKRLEDEAHIFNMTPLQVDRLKRDIGFDKRHVTLKDQCTSDLCEHAAKNLLSEMGYEPDSIDCAILVTQTPDYFQPATSYVLHDRLGLSRDCAAFDVNLGCSGYIYGLWLSGMMVSSGSCKRVLMLAGDTLSRCVSPLDRTTAPLFGDAGSATLIEKGMENETMTFCLHSEGAGYKHLIIPAGGFRKRASTETAEMIETEPGIMKSQEHLYMNGMEIFNFSIREVPALVEEVLIACNWSKGEVDYFILHQANKFIIRNIAKKLKVPSEKTPCDVFGNYGNQSSASIPATMCENLPFLKKNPAKVVLAGFGVGLSWAGCGLCLNSTGFYPIIVIE